jgi:hypothetical protein
MTKVQLNLNGESTVLGGPGPRAQQIIAFIKAIPAKPDKNGEHKYFDVDGIAAALKISRGAVQQRLRSNTGEIDGHQLLVPPTASGNRKLIFGSKAGIAKLTKDLQEAGLI